MRHRQPIKVSKLRIHDVDKGSGMGTSAGERSSPPPEVVAACGAIIVAAVIACFLAMDSAAGRPNLVRDFAGVGVLALLIIWGLLKRQNWLRWLLVLVYAVDAIAVVVFMARRGFFVLHPLLRLHASIQVITGVLLVLPKSNEWFNRHARSRTSPLRK